MADIKRAARAEWRGDSRSGSGKISTSSGAITDQPYSWSMRFENEPGTNPEELIAAAHAACYSMALASTLARQGHKLDEVQTEATLTMTRDDSGAKLAHMALKVRARLGTLDEQTFRKVAQEAEQNCPVSNLLRCGLTIELDAAYL
jgi:osmotically inducible protein OsmC